MDKRKIKKVEEILQQYRIDEEKIREVRIALMIKNSKMSRFWRIQTGFDCWADFEYNKLQKIHIHDNTNVISNALSIRNSYSKLLDMVMQILLVMK